MRVVCGWCGEVLEPGEPEGRTSHGVCPTCAREWLDEGHHVVPPPERTASGRLVAKEGP